MADNKIKKLNIIKGPMRGESFILSNDIIYIGRGIENDIKIEDKAISRRHIKITRKNDKFFIEDLWSHNGTWIEKNRIEPGEGIELREGMTFTIGSNLFSIENPLSKNKINQNREMKSNSWLVIDDRKDINGIINNLIANNELINLRIKGNDTVFTSRFLKIDDNEALFSTLRWKPNLIIEKLVPEKGNRLIQSVSEVDVEFPFKGHTWQCRLKYHGISVLDSHIGFIVRLPEYIEIKENRSELRSIYEIMGFVAAKFSLKKSPKKDKIYNLGIYNYSRNGLGLLITEEDIELCKLLKKEHRISDITFFTEEAMIKVDGTVKHITKIKNGINKGSYLLGIKSSAIIKS